MNFYKFHIGDYDSATAHLSWLEDCAYRRLLSLYYRTEAPIPRDVAAACRLLRAASKQERDAVRQVLAEFFELRDDGWHQRRCDDEIAHWQERAERNREVGKTGGRPPKTETQMVSKPEPGQEPNGNPNGFQMEPTKNPNHEPLTTNHEPLTTGSSEVTLRSTSPEPKALRGGAAQPASSAVEPAEKRHRKRHNGEQPPTAATWSAYSDAFCRRYGTEPTRNAKVNGQLAQLVERLGADDAPQVARFFVGHNRGLYVSGMHTVDLLLRDAEGLRAQWATSRPVTDLAARQVDATQTNANAFGDLIAEAQQRSVANG